MSSTTALLISAMVVVPLGAIAFYPIISCWLESRKLDKDLAGICDCSPEDIHDEMFYCPLCGKSFAP